MISKEYFQRRNRLSYLLGKVQRLVEAAYFHCDFLGLDVGLDTGPALCQPGATQAGENHAVLCLSILGQSNVVSFGRSVKLAELRKCVAEVDEEISVSERLANLIEDRQGCLIVLFVFCKRDSNTLCCVGVVRVQLERLVEKFDCLGVLFVPFLFVCLGLSAHLPCEHEVHVSHGNERIPVVLLQLL